MVRITRQNEREIFFDPVIASCRTNTAIFVPNPIKTYFCIDFKHMKKRWKIIKAAG